MPQLSSCRQLGQMPIRAIGFVWDAPDGEDGGCSNSARRQGSSAWCFRLGSNRSVSQMQRSRSGEIRVEIFDPVSAPALSARMPQVSISRGWRGRRLVRSRCGCGKRALSKLRLLMGRSSTQTPFNKRARTTVGGSSLSRVYKTYEALAPLASKSLRRSSRPGVWITTLASDLVSWRDSVGL